MATDTKQETQTWWRVRTAYGDKMTPHKVEKVTEKMIWWHETTYTGQTRIARSALSSKDEQWFDNETDAAEYLRSHLTRTVERLRGWLDAAEAALAAFNATHPLPVDEV
jgi:hypothetical protein